MAIQRMGEQGDLTEILEHINPVICDYNEWLQVGMALKAEGYAVAVWESWSLRDSARFHAGECEKKWDSFNGAANPVTGGTVYNIAVSQGWQPNADRESRALEWDDIIGENGDDGVIVRDGWIEDRELPTPNNSDGDNAAELIQYLSALFLENDYVGYVVGSYEKDGRYVPSNAGAYDRTAGQLIRQLKTCDNDIGAVLGDYNVAAGAWIRFNPLDGEGVKNVNVAAFRYALVESDNMPLERQNALIRELDLPVAALVHSGGKSLHAIVRIDAADMDEYRQRVDYLYSVLKKNGMDIDTQNKNPSRLSRMPGIRRGENRQYLVDKNIGKSSYTEWKEWIEAANDDLPDPVSLCDIWNEMPPLSPSLIDGVLRQGHKLMLAGPSKAGKSYALIELCIAIAEGRKWLSWQCAKGKVMYVNLELDHASCFHRFRDVYNAFGYPPDNLGNIDIWNLRGKSVPMDKLAPKLIRRAQKKNCIAIIIDPIYKVITGDENSADQMAHFCNQFDRVCTELGCAVIYCHHHSKGYQGGKRSMDRASGSGVFARDPDALIDLCELEIDEPLRKQQSNNAVCEVCVAALSETFKDWEDRISQDDRCSETAALEVCRGQLSREAYSNLLARVAAVREAVSHKTAWRIEGTLREFPTFEPVNLWFNYPIHKVDYANVLKEKGVPTSDNITVKEARQRGVEYKQNEKRDNWKMLETGFEMLNENGSTTITALMEYSNLSRNSIKTWADHQTGFERNDKGVITRVLTTDTEQ